MASNDPVSRLVLSVNTLQQELKAENYPLSVFNEELGTAVVRLTELALSRKAAAERVAVLEAELKGVKGALATARSDLGEVTSRLEGLGEDTLKLGQDAEELAARVRRGEKAVEERSAAVAALEARCLAARSWSKEQEEAREELERARDGAVSTLGDLRRALGEARKKEGDLRDAVERMEEEKSALDAKVESERGAVEALLAAAALALRRKEAKERAIEAERGRLVGLVAERERLQGLVAGSAEHAASTAAALRRDRDTLERYIREVDKAGGRVKALRGELEGVYEANAGWAREVEAGGVEVGVLQGEVARLVKEREKVVKLTALAREKTVEAEGACGVEGEGVAALERAVQEAEVEVLSASRAAAAAKGAAVDAGREKDVLAKGLARQGDKAAAAAAALRYQHSALNSIKGEVGGYLASLKSLRGEAEGVRGSLGAAGEALVQAGALHFEALERGRKAAVEGAAMEEKAKEAREGELKALSALSSARGAAGAAASALEEAVKRVARERSDCGVLRIELGHTKSQLSERDAAMVKTHFDLQKLEGGLEELKGEEAFLRSKTAQVRGELLGVQEECERLRVIEAAATTALSHARLACESLTAGKVAVSRGLNDVREALVAARERVAGNRMALGKGAGDYAGAVGVREAALRAIGVLKARVGVARAEADAADGGGSGSGSGSGSGGGGGGSGSGSGVASASAGYAATEDLLRARTEARVMGDELERPVNIHRWRGMAERDPEKWALLRRLHEGQARCIDARTRCTALEEALGEATDALERARVLAAKVPSASPAHGETVAALAGELKGKLGQLREVEAEREAAAGRVREWERERARAAEALEAMESAYVRAQRKAGGGGGAKRRPTLLPPSTPTMLTPIGEGEGGEGLVVDSRGATTAAASRITREADRLFQRFGAGPGGGGRGEEKKGEE